MEEKKPGKRLAQGAKPANAAAAPRRGLIALVAVAAALCAAYLALCAWASASGTIPPRTSAAGVDLGGQSRAAAQATLEESLSGRFRNTSVTITVSGAPETYAIPGDWVEADASAAAEAAWNLGRSSFFAQGWHYLASLVAGHEVEVPLHFTPEGERQVDALLGGIESELGGLVRETAWEVEGDDLVFHMGTPGRAFDLSTVKADILERFSSGESAPLELSAETTDPVPVDMDRVHSEVYTEVKDASLDPETFEIAPSADGLDFDPAAASAALEGAAWGSDVRVPLTVTEPLVSTESLRELLFRDVLGAATSRVTGTANRNSNVALAASTYNGRILLPGEVFSYNDTTGSRSADKGYLMAPVYKGGKSVDEVGGGICQPSSVLYNATLLANLEIVERHNHSFAVGYVPDGCDATVYYGSLDFRFKNDTAYPIKLVSEYYKNKKDGKTYLTVTIYGTKTDDLHVELTHKRYNDLPYTTVYQVDPELPAGTTRVEDTPYTGRTVETYRNIYNGKGELVSSTLETISKYKKRDKLIMVSPADAAQYGLTPDGQPLPSPVVTPTPAVTPTPVPTAEVPAVSPTPVPDPVPVETPVVTPAPAPEVTVPAETQEPVPATPDIGIPIAPSAPVDGADGQSEDTDL